MADLGTMLWKEVAELIGNRRFLRIFALAVLIMGLVPSLESRHAAAGANPLLTLLGLFYALFAGVIVVAQSAPDLVLHERSGRTLEYLLATRLSDSAIFAGKVLVASVLGYTSTLLTAAVQLLATNLQHHGAWTWSYLALPQGRLLILGASAALCVYLATVGTFVALRVGDQRAAYMVTMLSLAVLAAPLLLNLVHLHFTMSWLERAVALLGGLAIVLVALGVRLFKRELLVLSLQD